VGRFINRRIEKRLDAFDAKEDAIMARLPPLLYDPVTKQYYLKGTKPKARKNGEGRTIDGEEDSETGVNKDDEDDSIADIENGGFKSKISRKSEDMAEKDDLDEVASQKSLTLSEDVASSPSPSPSPNRKKRLPPIIPMGKRKLEKMKAREEEQRKWEEALARATYVPTRLEKIAIGKRNYTKNFIYKPPTKLGFQLTRERIEELGGLDGIKKLYMLKSPEYFHQLAKEEQKKFKRDPLDELPEWDTQSTVITSGSRRLKNGYRYQARRIIAVYEDPLLELHGEPDPGTVALMNLRHKRKEREMKEKELEMDMEFAKEEANREIEKKKKMEDVVLGDDVVVAKGQN